MQEKNVEEKIIQGKKNGLPALLGILLLYVAAVFGAVISGIMLDSVSGHMFIKIFFSLIMFLCLLVIALGWILLCGLKVLKPQEALVLTLFGKYIGTLKDEGFYFLNPFCSSVNPAARTRLSQSGDVNGMNTSGAAAGQESPSKKISLKIMTLNNSHQKINDCLGNPVEIGRASCRERV